MNANFILALSALLVLSSCHTLMENSNPYSSATPYKSTKNSKGETVYVREERPEGAFIMPPPALYPVTPTHPAPAPIAIAPTPSRDGSSSAELDSSGFKSGHAFLELARTNGNTHMGFHLGGLANDVLMGRLGGSIFFSEELYLGLDISARAYLPAKAFQPFAGVGAYYGDTKKCSQGYTDSTGRFVQVCEKKFLGAGYVELGLEVQNFSVFWRDYNVTRAGLAVPTESFWGIGLRF